MSRKDVVIVAAKRTPLGSFQGALSALMATELGSIAIKGALESIHLSSEKVEEVYVGCVLPAGLGQAPARQASIGAGVPNTVPCTTVNKVCGSGMKSVMLAYDQLRAGETNVIVSAGMESMTNAPYLLEKARGGYRIGHGKIYDHMFYDGLEDAYHKGRLMGTFAEDTAEKYKFSREDQDEFSRESARRAMKAIEIEAFQQEIIPVIIKSKKGEETVSIDETPTKINIDKIAKLNPAFKEDGTVTAASSASISDGAAAIVLMTADYAKENHYQPLAVIKGHATFAHDPEWFTTAPVGAIDKLLRKLDWDADDVDLFEINEAFAVVTMAAMHDHKIPHKKVNVNGGACALGHPVGASGTRLIVTLLHALQNRGLKRGIATLCIGGGEAVALAIECCS
nr:acetyl-CoA C-acyltransferase [Candidatus Paracaedibacter symbiosus]